MLLLVAVEHVDSNPPLVGKRSSHVHVCELLNVMEPSILLQLLAMGSSLTRILPMVPQCFKATSIGIQSIVRSSKDMRAGESLQNRFS